MRIHMQDIRLANNAGMSFPVCARNAELLDLDKTAWSIANDINKVTCKHCRKLFPKYYPWARKAKTS